MTTTRTITVFLAATLLLAGCTNDPGPAPTITDPHSTTTKTPAEPEPEPEPTRPGKTEAIQSLKDFTDINSEVAQNYYQDYDPQVLRFTTGEFRTQLGTMLYSAREAGAHKVGRTTLSGFKVLTMTENPEADQDLYTPNAQLVLEVCTDDAATDVILPNGSSAVVPGTAGRWVSTVTMERRRLGNGGEMWTISKYQTDRGRPCPD